jgi:hypothetical protein
VPGGIGDTAPGGGTATIAIFAFVLFAIGVLALASQSSAVQRFLDRRTGHEPVDVATDADAEVPLDDAPRTGAEPWPGFDPSFYGPLPAEPPEP